jgi:hypothetical protein
MIFYVDDMMLEPVREVFDGPENSVCICRDVQSPLSVYYTLLSVKNREIAKRLIAIFENSERTLPEGASPYVACFAQNTLLCYVFEYREERRLSHFAPGQITTAKAWESAFINLVLECLSSPLPFPLLSLSLEQGDLHLSRDGDVFFTPYYDLSRLSETDGEAVCARRCAETMLSLYTLKVKLKSAELMRKKLDKGAFKSLPELYRDIRITELPEKQKLRTRFGKAVRNNKDRAFRTLLVLSAVVAVFAVVVFVSQLIFGGVPAFRLFEKCFDIIGERSLR